MKTTHKIALLAALLLALTALGCADDDNTGDPQLNPEPEAQPEAQPEAEPEMVEPVDCDERDLFQTPFQGPGFGPEGELVEPVEGELLVVSTFAIAKDTEAAQTEFGAFIEPIIGSIMATEGLVGFSLGGSDLCRSGRTISIWRDEASMMRFVTSQAHADAMASASRLLDEARFARWAASEDDMPVTWEQALEEIDKTRPVRY